MPFCSIATASGKPLLEEVLHADLTQADLTQATLLLLLQSLQLCVSIHPYWSVSIV